MLVKETIDASQYDDLIVKDTPVGIFESVIFREDIYNYLSSSLCFEFYITRSANKTITKAAENIITNNQNGNYILGNIIRKKFLTKWTKIYDSLMKEYSPLDSNSYSKTITANNTEDVDRTYNSNEDLTVTKKINRNITTTDSDSRYGFNSTSASPATEKSENVNETVEQQPENNKGNKIKNDTSTDSKTFTKNESETYSGRDSSASDLISKEIDMRIRNIFSDIVLNDIDKFMCLKIYI